MGFSAVWISGRNHCPPHRVYLPQRTTPTLHCHLPYTEHNDNHRNHRNHHHSPFTNHYVTVPPKNSINDALPLVPAAPKNNAALPVALATTAGAGASASADVPTRAEVPTSQHAAHPLPCEKLDYVDDECVVYYFAASPRKRFFFVRSEPHLLERPGPSSCRSIASPLRTHLDSRKL